MARASGSKVRFATSLPSEGNQLYTPYIDLRGAALEDVRLYDEPADAPDPAASATLPDGIAGLADLREDRVEALLIDDASRAAGVRLETLGGLLASDPDAARRLLGDSSALPATDRFAQLTRAGWNQGVAIRVPAGARLQHPIVVRWSAGASRFSNPGRFPRVFLGLPDQKNVWKGPP